MTGPALTRRRLLRAAGLLPLAAAAPATAGCGVTRSLFPADVVRVAVTWSGSELDAFQAVVDGFRNSYPHYDLEVIPFGDDISAALSARTNSRPDVIMLTSPGLIAGYQDRLAPLPDGVWRDDWLAPAWRPVVWHPGPDGRNVPYGLPFKVANESVVWYRKDIFDRYGLTPPGTWSEWLRLNDILLGHGITPLALGGADGYPLAFFLSNVLRGLAPDFYLRLATPQPPAGLWESDTFVRALELVGSMWSVDGVFSGGAERTLALQFPDSVVEVFGYHRAAMVPIADFAAPVVERFIQPPAVADVFPFPAVDEVFPLVIGADLAVLRAPAGDGAKAFVDWLAQPDAALPWIRGYDGFVAANRRTPNTAYSPVERGLAARVDAALASEPAAVFDLVDAMGSFGASGSLYQVLGDFLRAVAGRPDLVGSAARQAAGDMAGMQRARCQTGVDCGG